MLSVLHAALAGAAVLMAVRDLGNGVVRLEDASLVDGGRLVVGAGWVPLAMPLGVVAADCLGVARKWLGLGAGEVSAGAARCVCDRLTEYCVW